MHLCVSLDVGKNVWHCNDCDTGGTSIDWVMMEKGMDFKQAVEELGGGEPANKSGQGTVQTPTPSATLESKEVKTYDYTDETGKLLYQVVRYEPKSFRQRQPEGDDWNWSLDGITRVLYNLPEVMKSETVLLCEGEKDADTLIGLGYCATTHCGGSSSWFPAYSEFLKGRNVLIFSDNDAAGDKHYRAVIASLDGKVNSAKKVNIPKEFKDISDYLETQEDKSTAVRNLIMSAVMAIEPLPLYTVYEMEEQFKEYVKEVNTRGFSLGRLAPAYGNKTMMPGELIMVMGDTGQGKTAFMQYMARSAKPLPTLFFELELPLEAMFMRNTQMECNCLEDDVLKDYREGTASMKEKFKNLEHILTCDRSGITMDYMERLIEQSELKFGKHPAMVMIDYMGLVKGVSFNRYEAMAAKAQQAKVLAKNTGTVVVMGSQVGRPQKDDKGNRGARKALSLHDARGAGELEESANLILGITKDNAEHPEDSDIVTVKTLKFTRGKVDKEVYFNFNGNTMQLTPCQTTT
jgi:5S rRNA maturation endonuclease (ribonuclease M5)